MTSSRDVADHYDTLDVLYRKYWGEHLHHGYWKDPKLSLNQAVEALVENVVKGLDIAQGNFVCDVGCGYGASLRYLARTRQIEGVGYTISQAQHRYATDFESSAGIKYLCEDFLSNSMPSNSCDAVYAIESSEHMADFSRFLQQIKRILKQGKRVAIAAWLRNPTTSRFLDRHLNDKIVKEGRLVQMYTVTEFINRVAQEFRVVHFEDISDNVAKTWWISAKNLATGIITDYETRQFVLHSTDKDRIFAITVLRILLAYRFNAMRYGIIVAEKI